MNNSVITIRINPETKARAQQLFGSLALDMSTAVNMFINEALEFQGIPFIIRRYNNGKEQAVLDAQTGICLDRTAVTDNVHDN